MPKNTLDRLNVCASRLGETPYPYPGHLALNYLEKKVGISTDYFMPWWEDRPVEQFVGARLARLEQRLGI